MREATIRAHKERLNRVLIYIQENIDNVLSLENLAQVACFSPFHFHRLFSAYTGETLGDHIRRIRLGKAAFKICHADESITTIALTAGYETPSAFTKAFRLHFGKSPSQFKQFKKQGLTVKTKLLDTHANEKEEKFMQPEIRSMPEQKVLFVRKTGKYNRAAHEAWPVLMKFAYSKKLMNKDTKCLGISYDDPDITPDDKIRYDACITISQDIKPEGEVGIQTISEGTYAVFLHKGPYSKLGDTYNAIFSQWLPASGAKLRNAPSFEIYLNRDPRRTKPENLKTEIHVPIE